MYGITHSPYQMCPDMCPGEDTPVSPHVKTTTSMERGHDEYIGKYNRQLICCVHAASGCDTTSAV